MPHEIEAKFLKIDVDATRAALLAAGYTCTRPWSLMRRHTFLLTELDNGIGEDQWARVRDEGDKVTMTYKHAFDTTRADGMEEVEFTVSSFENAAQFMQKIGFRKSLYQENFRETWMKSDMEVTLNEWPALAPFAEVEGPSVEEVQIASEALGFPYATAMFGGVGVLYKRTNNWDMDYVPELTFARAEEITTFMNSKVN